MQTEKKNEIIMEKTAEFVKTLNAAVSAFNLKDLNEVKAIQKLQTRLHELIIKLEKSDENVAKIIEQIENASYECKDVLYIRKNNELRAIISRDLINPKICSVEKLNCECTCEFKFPLEFEHSNGYLIVDTEERLRQLDSTLTHVIISVFEHSYRAYTPFSCIISLYTPEGYIYIIDAIRFRTVIPTLRLLKCGVGKVFTSQFDVDSICNDFGEIGCYRNFSIPEPELFVDWRIRPINEVLANIICDRLIKSVEKTQLGLPVEQHIPTKNNKVEAFLNKFGLTEVSAAAVESLLNFREYLAKVNNEGPQYVITDTQLFNLVVNVPVSLEEFEALFERMSSILRLHIGDILIILNRKSKIFSMEELKTKKETVKSKEANNELGNSLQHQMLQESTESDLVISEEYN